MREPLDALDPRTLSTLKAAMERSPLIIELSLTHSPHEPERMVFNRYERLVDFLDRVARHGDQVRAWAFDDVCRGDNALVNVVFPAARDAR